MENQIISLQNSQKTGCRTEIVSGMLVFNGGVVPLLSSQRFCLSGYASPVVIGVPHVKGEDIVAGIISLSFNTSLKQKT